MKYCPTTHQGEARGAVLVLALLVLSFVMFAALSLTSVLIVELRSAQYLDSAIIAHYAAESGAEKALFKLKEAHSIDELGGTSAGAPYDDFFSLPTDAAESGSLIPGDTDRSFGFSNISQSSQNFTAYNIPVNQSIQFDIFDPNQETSNPINTTATLMTIDWLGFSCRSNDRLEVSLVGMQNTQNGLAIVTDEFNTRRDYFGCGCSSDSPACSPVIQLTIKRDSFYRVTLRPIDNPVKQLVATLYNTENSETVAVPIPSQVYIQTTGRFRDATQTVTVQTPWNSGVSDIFNYVIFSESSLIKNVTSQGTFTFQTQCGSCVDKPEIKCSSNSDCATGDCEKNEIAYCTDNGTESTGESEVLGEFNQTIYGTCNARCSGLTYCGDGIQQGTATGGSNGEGTNEQCDDGNGSDTDQCTIACVATTCGDGIVQGPESSGKGPNSNGVYEACDEGICGTPGHTSPNCNGSGVVGHCNATCTGVTVNQNTNTCRRNCNLPINSGG